MCPASDSCLVRDGLNSVVRTTTDGRLRAAVGIGNAAANSRTPGIGGNGVVSSTGYEKWTPKFGPEAKLDFSGSAGHEKTAEL